MQGCARKVLNETSQTFRVAEHSPTLGNSVCQTNFASSNLSLNIQGHIEVPKSKFKKKKSCLSAVISLYMSRFSRIREF